MNAQPENCYRGNAYHTQILDHKNWYICTWTHYFKWSISQENYLYSQIVITKRKPNTNNIGFLYGALYSTEYFPAIYVGLYVFPLLLTVFSRPSPVLLLLVR